MPHSRTYLVAATILTTSALAAASEYTRLRLVDLEARYPALPAPTTPTFIIAPKDHHPASARLFSFRPQTTLNPQTCAHHYLNSRLPRLAAFLTSPVSSLLLQEPEFPGFYPGQRLLGGVYRVVYTDRYAVVLEWVMPAHVVRFIEVVAGWGFGCRLMSGGRHEWVVDGDEVRWGSVDFYHDLGDGKVIPAWAERLQRGYARYLVDSAVQEMAVRKVREIRGQRNHK